MQRLEVSCAVRHIYMSLGFKGLASIWLSRVAESCSFLSVLLIKCCVRPDSCQNVTMFHPTPKCTHTQLLGSIRRLVAFLPLDHVACTSRKPSPRNPLMNAVKNSPLIQLRQTRNLGG